MSKTVRSHSVHEAVSRDRDRQKMAERQELKCEKQYDSLARRMNAHAKWNQRADKNQLSTTTSQQPRPVTTLEEFMQRERVKQDQIIQAKKLANGRIRHA